MTIIDCNVSQLFFQTILDNNPHLTSVRLSMSDVSTSPLTNGSLINISKVRNLRRLTLFDFGINDSNLDLVCLGSKEKLDYLCLGYLSIREGPLFKLWDGLVMLTTLLLTDLAMLDEGFAGICGLQNLKHLEISCLEITGGCFVSTVSSLNVLEKLSFDVELFPDVYDQGALSLAVAPLNEIRSLRRLNFPVRDGSSRILRSLCWKVKKWIVTAGTDHYSLHRGECY